MIEEEKIIEIIQRKLANELSLEDTNTLNEWLKVPSNAASYTQYEQIWTVTSSIASKKEDFVINSYDSWNSIEHLIVADKPKRKFNLVYAVAASLALVLMLAGASFFFNANQNISFVLERNQKDTITFSDGSMAYLFGPCSITYPEQFNASERILSMDGFVYFDIAHDESRPFEINTVNGKVEVLGTSFTVDTRTNETFTVQCISGKVRMTALNNGNTYETILTRNKMATYSKESKQLNVTPFEAIDLSIDVPIRNMTFNNKPLGEILKRIEYNYGVNIQLENENLLDMKYSTSLNDTTIDDFFNELKITFKVEVIQSKPSTYILKGGNSN